MTPAMRDGSPNRCGWAWPGGDRIKSWTAAKLQIPKAETFTELQAQILLESVRKHAGLAEWIESAVLKAVKPRGEFQRLQQVPGIGPILGMVVVLEICEFSRFASAGDYASCCRTVRSERTSNGKKKGDNNRRSGNPYLAWAFAEAAVFAVRFYPKIAA